MPPQPGALVARIRALRLERSALRSRPKSFVEIDRAAFDGNARRRQFSRVLIDALSADDFCRRDVAPGSALQKQATAA